MELMDKMVTVFGKALLLVGEIAPLVVFIQLFNKFTHWDSGLKYTIAIALWLLYIYADISYRRRQIEKAVEKERVATIRGY